MISSYRLGDLVLLQLDEPAINLILNDHPESIGAEYILKKRQHPKRNNIDIITEIVTNRISIYSSQFPEDISESTLIHLRLGDVVSGNKWHEKIKRPIDAETLKSMLEPYPEKRYVIGKCFFAAPSSTNYEECVEASEKYLQRVLEILGAEHFDSNNADVDLCCAIRSKLFVQGKGFFSRLIVDIRNKLNLPSIETQTTN